MLFVLFLLYLVILLLDRGSSCLLCLSRSALRSRTLSLPVAAIDYPARPCNILRSRKIMQLGASARKVKDKYEDSEAVFDPLRYDDKELGDSNDEDDNIDPIDDYSGLNEEEKGLKKVMLASIRWYKSTLSPLMPPNCRFLPTCSSYGLDSIKKFGPVKGGILTAWRIMRCTPFGGSGYDPPQWPPPGYRAGSNTKRWF